MNTDWIDNRNAMARKNAETAKAIEAEGKIPCPNCQNYYIDPKQYSVCWECHGKSGR